MARLIVPLLLALSLCACTAKEAQAVPEPSSSAAPAQVEAVFQSEPIPQAVRQKMIGVSWVENEHVGLDDLSLCTLTYHGFDGDTHTGQMVVNAAVADDVTAIFKELYEAEYPIEKICLIDDYGASDEASMADNNSSAFCYRVIDGTQYISNHALGLAVDINPLQNPYVRGDNVQPEAGRDYLDRDNVRPGMIVPGDACYNAFLSRGWTWGGEWTSPSPTDYQHFEKALE
ncbi:M15 family metallopeptidase [Harryflintia acetispora]|uniref:D-alanyl-D-alanine carboxypeptidase-like protein n=1 Tax=Harryflintia acetispora TaxID=1849041 RepID=A0A9X8ULC6_9FIRM|nr:M15 family metallopeptidase [Harryflintia acetispora]TCL45304.1 D-alanyl-D-alanine carboxypeptidase-like protein [Harryflintia acetispora]